MNSERGVLVTTCRTSFVAGWTSRILPKKCKWMETEQPGGEGEMGILEEFGACAGKVIQKSEE